MEEVTRQDVNPMLAEYDQRTEGTGALALIAAIAESIELARRHKSSVLIQTARNNGAVVRVSLLNQTRAIDSGIVIDPDGDFWLMQPE